MKLTFFHINKYNHCFKLRDFAEKMSWYFKKITLFEKLNNIQFENHFILFPNFSDTLYLENSVSTVTNIIFV